MKNLFYEKKLRLAEEALESGSYDKETIEYIFPELKEFADKGYENAVECIDWLEKQETFYTKKDIDDAYLNGINDAKNEIRKQHEANYQIRKDIATFIFNYRGDIKDRAKWMNYLDVKISFVEKQGEKPQGKTALEAIKEKPADNANKVASAWNNGYSNGYIHAIEKACDWLENHNDYIDVKDGNATYFDMEKCVKDFSKYMRGGDE